MINTLLQSYIPDFAFGFRFDALPLVLLIIVLILFYVIRHYTGRDGKKSNNVSC